MNKPVDCPYYFADYHRGRDEEKCRLIERNPENRRPWHRSLCDSCPVPGILRQTTCEHLALEASVGRKFGILDRVELYAICTEHVVELPDPKRCPACEADRAKRRAANAEGQ
jgi:hypothetical protein